MAGRGRRNNSSSLDFPVLIISIFAGIVAMLVSVFAYRWLLKDALWSPLAVGLSFMIFALVFIIIMVIVSMINDNLGYHLSQFHDGGKIFGALAGVIALTLILGTLFEFIYEIDLFGGPNGYQEPTSYVFVIDNSASMESSDPDSLRYQAIEEIISSKDQSFPYAVYGFNNEVSEERALAPISSGNNEFEPVNTGGTEILKTLTLLYDEYENNLKQNLGKSPKFLLLSDGHATDIGFFNSIDKILKEYAKTNITISTVGLGSADDILLQQIADDTGGVYLSVDNVDHLEQSMQQAIVKTGDNKYARTLYTYRNVPSLDFLYALMRIIFTAILGILISGSMLFATGKGEDSQLIIMSSVISGIVAGLLLELGINLLGVPPMIMIFIYFILVAVTFTTLKAFSGNGRGRKYQDDEDMFGGGKRLNMGKQNSLGEFSGGASGSGTANGSGGGSFNDFDW